MAARSRGLGLTSKDMNIHVLQEASRLVFVFVKDSKPRRKVAIPVLDSYSWEQFLDQVKAKLRVAGVEDIYLSSNGHRVRNVSELQDIDELCVVEGPEAPTANGSSAFSAVVQQRSTAELPQLSEPSGQEATALPIMSPAMRQQSMQERHKVAISADGLRTSGSLSYGADEDDNKYVRRAHPVRRWLQRIMPNVFAPGLPVTNRDAQVDVSGDGNKSSSSSRRRRPRRSQYNFRNLLLVLATMCCVATMLYMFIRVSTSAAVGSLGTGSAQLTSISSIEQQAAAAAGSAATAATAVKEAAGGAANGGGTGTVGAAAQVAGEAAGAGVGAATGAGSKP